MKQKFLIFSMFFTLFSIFLLITCQTKYKEKNDLNESKFLYQTEVHWSNTGVIYTFRRHPSKGVLLENNKPFTSLNTSSKVQYYLEDKNGKRFNFSSLDAFPELTVISGLKNNIKIYKILPSSNKPELLFED